MMGLAPTFLGAKHRAQGTWVSAVFRGGAPYDTHDTLLSLLNGWSVNNTRVERGVISGSKTIGKDGCKSDMGVTRAGRSFGDERAENNQFAIFCVEDPTP